MYRRFFGGGSEARAFGFPIILLAFALWWLGLVRALAEAGRRGVEGNGTISLHRCVFKVNLASARKVCLCALRLKASAGLDRFRERLTALRMDRERLWGMTRLFLGHDYSLLYGGKKAEIIK